MSVWTKVKRHSTRLFLKHTYVKRVALATVVVVLLMVFITSTLMPQQLDIQIGQESPITVLAPRDVVDEKATEEERERASRSIPDVYRRDSTVEEQVLGEVEEIFVVFEKMTQMEEPQDDVLTTFFGLLPQDLAMKLSDFNEEMVETVLVMEEEEVLALQTDTLTIIENTFAEGVMSFNAGLILIQHRVNALDRPLRERSFIEKVGESLFQPNQSKDVEATDALRQEARDNVPQVVVKQGELVVRQGQLVNERIYLIMQKLGMLRAGRDYQLIFGTMLYILLTMLCLVLYLRTFEKKTYEDTNSLVLLAFVMLLGVGLSRFAVIFSGYLVPVSAMAILISVLLSNRVALISTLVLTALVALFTDGQMQYLVVALAGSLAGIFTVAFMRQRSDLLRAGLYIALVNAVTILAFNLIGGGTWSQTVVEISLGVVNGIFSAVLAIGSLPYFENLFGITSIVKLLELSNPNQPLLRRLLTEAPGTYHHSIIVGNLAEAAAEEVGADALLVRVGAYYHDIGKIKRPYFFIENQFTSENPHDNYSPSLSTLIITAHVKDGVELAREAKLPEKIVDIIEQHHGTTLVQYFYHAAQEEKKGDGVQEDDYRYDGPAPQTKEAAIVMLSDSIEAAVRSLAKPTPGRIEGLVRKIIRERLNSGELDACDLTLKDLDLMAKAYVHILTGIFHNRIEYPERSIADLERSRRLSGTINK